MELLQTMKLLTNSGISYIYEIGKGNRGYSAAIEIKPDSYNELGNFDDSESAFKTIIKHCLSKCIKYKHELVELHNEDTHTDLIDIATQRKLLHKLCPKVKIKG
jgi:hypothetical protein